MGERPHHPDDESTDAWYWMVRGFVTVAVVVAALAALGVWLWLRPLREGPAQSFGLWLSCMLLVGCAVLVWSPEHRRAGADTHRVREWLVVGALVAVSGVMALIGVLVTREDRRPVLRGIVEMAVEGQPVTFVQETTWAYQPRFVGGLGTSDWSVCRTYVVAGPPGPVAEHVTVALENEGVELGTHQPGDTTPRYGEVRVEGDAGDRMVVCVDEVDPANRASDDAAPVGPSGPAITLEPATGLTNGQEVTVRGSGFPADASIGYAQCAVGALAMEACDTSSSSFGSADASGAITVSVRVRAVIGTPGGLVDCSVSGACELLVGMLPDAAISAAAPLEVAPSQASTAFPEPSCPGPYSPVGYFRGAVDAPQVPPNVSGTAEPYVEAGAAVAAVKDGETLLLTVAYQGATRQFTTAPHPAGGNYDRTPGPSDTPYGLVSIVTADDGAVYVTLEQNNSGDYTRIGWRFDDPCAAA